MGLFFYATNNLQNRGFTAMIEIGMNQIVKNYGF